MIIIITIIIITIIINIIMLLSSLCAQRAAGAGYSSGIPLMKMKKTSNAATINNLLVTGGRWVVGGY